MRWMPVLAMLCACGDSNERPDAATSHDAPVLDAQPDAPADAPVDADPNMPATLMDTGLCVDAACTEIAAGIVPYTPRWELWSDGATKRRWIYLPPGTQIDTSDMDYWQFPVGTKLWKEFTRDGVRVETRLVMRIGAGNTSADWFYMPYVWNQAQDQAVAEKFGVPDANGTEHDVPNQVQCKQCHDNLEPARVLGFGALELDYDNADDAQLDLSALVAGGLLTDPPTLAAASYFPLPGTPADQAALGYLHTNCGHCHNPNSKVTIDITPIKLRLAVGSLGTVQATPAYTTTVNVTGMTVDTLTTLVIPGDPDQSILTHRFESTNTSVRMPLLGTEIIDPTGTTILRDWVTNLP